VLYKYCSWSWVGLIIVLGRAEGECAGRSISSWLIIVPGREEQEEPPIYPCDVSGASIIWTRRARTINKEIQRARPIMQDPRHYSPHDFIQYYTRLFITVTVTSI
jgi:hypothetical protein